MLNFISHVHSSADYFDRIPFSCRSLLVCGFCNQGAYLIIFIARDVHSWTSGRKTSVHVEGEGSGK